MRAALLIFVSALAAHAAQPQRIVSTTPSITELLYALGAGDRVAGVTNYCRYPAEAQTKPKIGSYTEPNIEAIAALRPDLVITQINPIRLTERLRALRLNVKEVRQDNIASLYTSFREVGDAIGSSPQAAQLIERVRAGLDEVRAKASPQKRVRVMFVVGRAPARLDGIIVVGRASYLNEIIDLAGGENIFRDAVASYPAVSLESVLARNPEVIIDMGEMADTVGVTDARKQAVVRLWSQMGALTAVKTGRVFAVASDTYVIPGPRVVDGARAFLRMLHPEVK